MRCNLQSSAACHKLPATLWGSPNSSVETELMGLGLTFEGSTLLPCSSSCLHSQADMTLYHVCVCHNGHASFVVAMPVISDWLSGARICTTFAHVLCDGILVGIAATAEMHSDVKCAKACVAIFVLNSKPSVVLRTAFKSIAAQVKGEWPAGLQLTCAWLCAGMGWGDVSSRKCASVCAPSRDVRM